MQSVETEKDAMARRLEAIGQEHLLHFWDSLDAPAREALIDQLRELEFERIPGYVERYVRGSGGASAPSSIKPATYYALRDRGTSWDADAYMARGAELISAGKVAAFTVAGGQGSRLGYEGPKGEYPGGAVSGKPLFACLAEWITAAQRRWDARIPWYIMTSPLNHEATEAFFTKHCHFGLDPASIMFFQQGVMPSFDMETGRILLSEPGVIATNPDGHGGSLKALHRSGALKDMRERGVEQISYCQIDNPLVRVIDPLFVGLHVAAPDSSGEMSSKMVAKTDPGEKVGVFAKVEGRTQVVEYSDLPEDLAAKRDTDDSLTYKCGSIAIHMLSVAFVERLNEGGGFALPFHKAKKKVPCVDESTGEPITPSEPNGVKLETFVFDALAECGSSIVLETDRVEEFAPIKNAQGNDSPESCARIQSERAASWIEQSGREVPRTPQGAVDCTIEVSPLTAMWAEDLESAQVPAIESGAKVAF